LQKGGKKMVRQGKFLMVIILFFLFGTVAFGQDKKIDTEQDKKLREEILSIYKSKGEEGLRGFVKDKKDTISNKFIVDFAESGVKERKAEWLKACEIMAEEKKDEKTLAEAYYQVSEYFRFIENYKKANLYLEKTLPIYIKLNDPSGQAKTYLSKGMIHYYTGNNSQAFEMYNKANRLFKKSGDIRGQGIVYWRMGAIYWLRANNSRAIEMYDKALSLFEKLGDKVNKGNLFFSIGLLYLQTGEHDKAIEMCEKSLFILRNTGDIMGLGKAFFLKGEVNLMTGDYSKALEMFEEALSFFLQSGYTSGQANVHRSKGVIYFNTGNNQKALESYDKALSLFEKAVNPLGQGNIYFSKGKIYSKIGYNSKALKFYKKALIFYEKVEDDVGQGNVYWRMGDICLQTADILKALAFFERAMLLYKKAEEPIGQGKVYWGKGDIYLSIGESSRAIEMYDKALSFFKKAGDPIGEGHVYKSKGTVYFYNGEYSRAIAMYDKALYFFKKVGDTSGLADILRYKGEIFFIFDDIPNSIKMYNKAIPLLESSGEYRGMGILYRNKGDIYFKSGDIYNALNMYEKALTCFKKVGDIELESFTLHDKAIAFEKLGRKSEALTNHEGGINKLERVRKQTSFPNLQKTYMMAISYDQYEDTALFMLENKYYDRGFKYAESMKARVFLNLLSEGLTKMDKGISLDLKQNRDRLVSRLSILSKEISETARKKDEEKLKELKEQHRKVDNELENLLVKIRLNNPLYASLRYPGPIPVKKLRKKVLKKGELLLRFFVSNEKVYVFLVSKKRFRVIDLNAKKTDVDRMVNRYLLSTKTIDNEKLIKYGEDLYQSLFKPVEAFLNGKKNLIIVPDGQLATIPFESFVIDKDQSSNPIYLLEKYRIKYIQSASVLATLRKHYHRKGKTQNFIGFGDPVYDYENFKKCLPEQGSPGQGKGDEIKEIHRGKYDREGRVLNRLQGSGQEVEAIAGLFKKQNQKCVVHLREQATEENAKSLDLKEFDYIHFSCHGVLGDGFQSLVLSQIPKAKEDGYLTLNEIMNCDYNAKLVVLSACKTGSGKVERGEGVIGLTRAVMYAGTPAVVASLWNVKDIATKELMVKFYKNMLEKGMKKEEALRQAKLEMIKEGTYASPYYWSAFVMYGE
jgi:CHAT domain-containing protein/Tfp pilus assembly protein PilF